MEELYTTASSVFSVNPPQDGIVSDGPTLEIQNYPAPHFGNIRVLLINRPHARNSISRRLVVDLKHHVDEIMAEGGTGNTRALIVASNLDDVFCAGSDLAERKSMTHEQLVDYITSCRKTFTDLSNLPIPTISAVSSRAIGGGLELALCTTFRVFASTAVVGVPEVKLAAMPGAGGTYRLPALIGVNKAKDLILTGRNVKGIEAMFLGLCNRVVEITPEDVKVEGAARQKILDASIQLASLICEGGPIGVTQAIRAVDSWQDGEAAEKEGYRVLMMSEDRLEAVKALTEKRVPVFKGR